MSSLMFKGSLTGELFVTWVRESLCPVLKAEYLPPYSPDLNPIEKMWSKVKAILRGLKVRGEEEIFREAGNALSQVTDDDAKGWFQSCNYCLSF